MYRNATFKARIKVPTYAWLFDKETLDQYEANKVMKFSVARTVTVNPETHAFCLATRFITITQTLELKEHFVRTSAFAHCILDTGEIGWIADDYDDSVFSRTAIHERF